MAKNIIGIDLGTTMSAIARLLKTGENVEIIPTRDGERIMPSVVHFSEFDDSVLIGDDAKGMLDDFPERTASFFKRKMGDKNFKFMVDNKNYSAIELSAFVLKKLVNDASSQIGKIKKVVISVPAYFKEYERKATIEAGRIAGLDVIGIVNEPSAAALYYAFNLNMNGNYLIYDLGGGTFDISLVEIRNKDVKVLNSLGNSKLGGIDFDRELLSIVEKKFKEKTGKNLITDKSRIPELLNETERKKKALSKLKDISFNLKSDNAKARVTVTREEFEESIYKYILETELLMKQVLSEVNLEKSDIKDVLLVGGSTRIPLVKKFIKDFFGKEAKDLVNVDEVVALGAALKAGLKENLTEVSRLKMQDVANHSYGQILFEAFSDKKFNKIIIKKNTPIPVTKTSESMTRYDNQEFIFIEVTQGEDRDPNYVDVIDEIVLDLNDLYAGNTNRPAGQPVEVTYSYDENQIMHCRVLDINSGKEKTKSINISIFENKNDLNNENII